MCQNSAARLTSRCGKFDSITPVLAKLYWLPIPDWIVYKILTITYKALKGLMSPYLSDLLTPYTPSRSLRSSDSELLATHVSALTSTAAEWLNLLYPPYITPSPLLSDSLLPSQHSNLFLRLISSKMPFLTPASFPALPGIHLLLLAYP